MGQILSSSSNFGEDPDKKDIEKYIKQLRESEEKDIKKSNDASIIDYKHFIDTFLAKKGDVRYAIEIINKQDFYKSRLHSMNAFFYGKNEDDDAKFIKKYLNPILKEGNLDKLKKFMSENEERCKKLFIRLEKFGSPKIDFTKIVEDIDDTLKKDHKTNFDININYNK